MILKWNDNSCFSALWHYVSISFCKHKRIWNGDIVKKIHDNVESSRNFDYMKSNISAKQILYVRVLHNINATWKRPPFLNMFSKNIAFTSWKKSHLHVHAIFASERSFFVTLYITDLFWNMLQFLCQIFTMKTSIKNVKDL